jgi:hypothetical protein
MTKTKTKNATAYFLGISHRTVFLITLLLLTTGVGVSYAFPFPFSYFPLSLLVTTICVDTYIFV